MNRYQEFYNQQREWKGTNNQQNRRSIFRHVRKERRTRTFDLFRGDIAVYEPEEIKPVPKFTFRDTISKLIKDQKKKVIQKPRPFVVGTVKHKIHSPPFLHEGYKSKELKKKLTTPIQNSFAPSNYKFKIPKGLAMNFETSLGEENPVISSFALNTVWNKLDNKNTRRKDFLHDNITHREKKRTYLDHPNNIFSTANENAEQKSAKRELWPEALDEEPVFGRLNLKRMSKSLDNQAEDNKKEATDSSQVKISHSVLLNSSFNINNEEEYDKVKIKNLELIVDSNVEPNTISTTKSIHNSDANISIISNEHENEMPTPSAETMQMDYRLSRISPPNTILSNTIFNFDNTETQTGNNSPNPEDINLLCSKPSVQNILKDIPVQFGNSSNASMPSTSCTIQEDTIKEWSPSYKGAIIEGDTSIISPSGEYSTNFKNGSRIEDSNLTIGSEKTSLDIECSKNQKILNLTFTKSLGLIEEDEGDDEEETIKLNLENLNKEYTKEDKINSSPVMTILNSNNVNKPNVESKNVHEAEYNVPTSKNTSSEIENNDNSKEIPSLSRSNLQDNCTDQIINVVQQNVVSPRKSSIELINQVIINTSELVSNQTNFDKDENLKNPSEMPVEIVPKINIEHNNSKKLDDDHSQAQESEQLIPTSNSTLSNSLIPIEDQQTEVNYTETVIEGISKDRYDDKYPCNLSSISTSRRIAENKNVSSNAETGTDDSQGKENKQLIATSNSISSNSQILFGDQQTEVNYVKPESEDNNEDCYGSCDMSSVKTSNHRTTEDKNVGLGRIIYSCPTKLINNIESTDQHLTSHDLLEINIVTSSQAEKERDSTAKVHHLLDSTDTEKSVSNETNNKIQIKITSPTGLEKPVLQVATDTKSAHAGPVQTRHSANNEPVIDLTDSPIQLTIRKSTKPELRKSALDYKSPLLSLSKPNRNSILSGSDENGVIDLISDEEEDYTCYLSRILKKHVETSSSPKQSPRNRTPLASIGNVPRLSSSWTPQSPFVSKVNSPAKKTPILISETIPMVRVSPSPAPLEMLHDTPRKTPRRRKALKEITTEAAEVPSPLRVMNLRNRNISISPSPNRKTPRAVTPRKTPIQCNVMKEVAAEATEDTGHLRVMNLRSRNVNVSPSPKKMTPRRRKNNNQCA